MTRDEAVFTRAGAWLGWLVVAGGVPSDPMELVLVSDRLLERTDPSLPAFWVDPERAANPAFERMIEDLDLVLSAPVERLGSGEPAPVEVVDVGLIVMGGVDQGCWSEALRSSATGEWVAGRLQQGSVVFAGGAAAAALGDRIFHERAEPEGVSGLGWLPGAVLLPGVTDPADHPTVKRYLTRTDHSYALGLPQGTAVALGPQGQVEVWAGDPPKLVLGKGWMPG
jgi:hypothetical protein